VLAGRRPRAPDPVEVSGISVTTARLSLVAARSNSSIRGKGKRLGRLRRAGRVPSTLSLAATSFIHPRSRCRCGGSAQSRV